jgi:hypothetical protein
MGRPADDWKRTNISEYWDYRTNGIFEFSQRLRDEAPDERASILKKITKTIPNVATPMADDELLLTAVSFVDDLYKTVALTDPIAWDETESKYLQACGGTMSTLLKRRGYVVEFVIDNTYKDLRRPLQLFRDWFGNADLFFTCPQEVAMRLMQKDAVPVEATLPNLPKYIEEARHVSGALVGRCHSEGRHFVYLDTDAEEDSFEIPLSYVGQPGVLAIFRNDAPASGSKVQVGLPNQPRNPNG